MSYLVDEVTFARSDGLFLVKGRNVARVKVWGRRGNWRLGRRRGHLPHFHDLSAPRSVNEQILSRLLMYSRVLLPLLKLWTTRKDRLSVFGWQFRPWASTEEKFPISPFSFRDWWSLRQESGVEIESRLLFLPIDESLSLFFFSASLFLRIWKLFLALLLIPIFQSFIHGNRPFDVFPPGGSNSRSTFFFHFWSRTTSIRKWVEGNAPKGDEKKDCFTDCL